MPFHFRRPTTDDAELLLGWRTDPSITRFMYTDLDHRDVGRQRAWIESVAGRDDFSHFVIEHDERPIGYLSYSAIDRVHRHCGSGSYIGDAQARRTVAGFLHSFIMDYCFHGLGMNKIVNHFMAGNDRVIRIQRLLKCREVGVLQDHVWKYGRFHDVHVFEVLRRDWDDQPRVFPLERTLAAFDP